MSGGVINALNAQLGRVFPERRVYVRTDARTRYWTFSPISQTGTACVLLGVLGWSLLTTVAFVDNAMDGRTVDNRLESSREAYEIKLAGLREQQRLLEEELNRSNERGDVVTGELSEKQQLLVRTTVDLRAAQAELSGLREEFETLLTERREKIAELKAREDEMVRLRLELAEAKQNDLELAETLATFTTTMGEVIAVRDQAVNHARNLDRKVASLETEIARWESKQENLVAQLEDATRTSLSAFDELFVGSDVDLESILMQTRRDYTGRGGGPIDDEPDDVPGMEDHSAAPEDDVRLASLMTDVERMSLMRVAIDRLPFGLPAKGARRTSGFGPRRDPYRRSSRMHNGVDFAGPVGTPIYSTGEGVVTFSARQRGYGIVVKIRHAFGFETVYAHLSKSRVKVGQRVARGDRIADMGNTGRSTGSHLHYEIRIDGKPINPNKFIKADRNVL